MDQFYPGITEKGNQWPGSDEVGARGYDLLSDTDDLLTVAYKDANPGMLALINGSCYLTKDGVAFALNNDIP